MNRTELIAAARGDRPLDLAITNVNLVNVFTCEIYPADIGIYGERIALVGPAGAYDLQAKETIDGSGKWATPGFVDTHLHIESTMVTPANYAAGVLPFGTTTSIIDPHEIGNVLGMEGVRYMVEGSEGLPLRVYIAVPSCVPAVPGLETAGADFGPDEVAEMLTWPRVISVAEVMDFIGVVNGSPKMVGIIEAGLEAGATIQGHSPLLMGRDVNAYAAAGIDNDHELRAGEEGLEKLRLGILPLLKSNRRGNHARRIMPFLKQAPFLEIALCTDDIEPAELLEDGHMDHIIREMFYHGVEPALAIRWATYNGARHYGLRHHGAIAPGYFADILLLSSLEEVRTSEVFVSGKLVVQDGVLITPIAEPSTSMEITNSVHLQPLTEEDFRLKPPLQGGILGESGHVRVNLMVLEATRMTSLETAMGRVRDGVLVPGSLGEDICTVAVVPRHGQTHKPALALLKGLGMRRGTLATTISHDSHNIIVTGHEPADMLMAVRELEACGGGIIIVDQGEVLAKVELPVAGLMSLEPVSALAEEMRVLNEIAVNLGIKHGPKALSTCGLALTVIPEIRISDLVGLMDVATQKVVPVFLDG